MKKKLGIVLGILLLALGGWLLYQALLPAQEVEDAREPELTALPISPFAPADRQEEYQATLYYRYLDSTYLAQEQRTLQVGLGQTVEEAIIQALLSGPDANMLELRGLFAGNVKVISTEAQGDLLTITISDTLLEPPQDAPENWETYPYWREEIPRRRYLALCSLVNALTEDGRYAQVLLLVASPLEGQGRRVSRMLFDAAVTDASLLLEPIGRQESSILTAANTLQYLLRCWQRKDWISLYTLLMSGQEGGEIPSQTTFLEEVARLECSLMNFQVSGGSVRVDGAQATVLLTGQLMSGRGDLYRVTDFPIVLRRERGCWKMGYDALLSLMSMP